jgi:hypothetical protein
MMQSVGPAIGRKKRACLRPYFVSDILISVFCQFIKMLYTVFYFLISDFLHVLNVVFFLLGNSPVYEFYVSTFRNTLCVPSL